MTSVDGAADPPLVAVGAPLPAVRIDAVGAEPMKVMALLLRDSNPIHFDAHAVAEVGLGERTVNQGPINVGYVMTMLADWAGGHDRIRDVHVRFQANVFAGDAVVTGGVVTDVDADGGATRVGCDVWLDHADGHRVLQGRAELVLPAGG